MSRGFEGRGVDGGFVPLPKAHERRAATPEEKAKWAENVAANLQLQRQQVEEGIAALSSAHDVRDPAAYQRAREAVNASLSLLRRYESVAKEYARDAQDAGVRAVLEHATSLVAEAENLLAVAPPPPVPVAPSLACESALLAALPQLDHVGPLGAMFDRARVEVARVFREQMSFSDFAAFETILREHPEHEIAVRFSRFKPETQASLRSILTDDAKVRVAAREREAAARATSPAQAPSVGRDQIPPTSELSAVRAASSRGAPIDPESPGAREAPDVVAERGIQSEGRPLPHAEQIQTAFGRHDVSRLRAHLGGEAATAARQLGALAFTTGNDVAFAESPDIGLAAHEAVHHVQQRAGVALKSQLDEPGDEYEQQADAIAAKVTRGQSVEADLDLIVGNGSRATHAHSVVQRKTGDVHRAAGSGGFPLYVDKHQNVLRQAVARHLSDTAWPDPASDLRWAPGGDHMFTAVLWQLLAPRLGDANALRALLPKGKLEERFERYVGTYSPSAPWSSAFGKAVGQLVEWAVRDALVERVGRRYRRIYATRREPPEADELVSGHPLDALVAHALVTSGGVDLFEIPTEEARGPVDLSPKTNRASSKRQKQADAPSHALGHEEGAPTRAKLMAIELGIGAKLTAIHGQVARLGFAEQIQAARDVHANRVAMLDEADAATRTHYLPVLQFQHTQLLSIAPLLAAVIEQYWPLRGIPEFALTPERRVERSELEALLDIYVRAVATSHDRARSTAILRQVDERARWKQRDRIDAAQVSAEVAVDEMVTTTPSERVDREGLELVRTQRQSMLDDTAKGRSHYEQQKAVTVGHETALRARMASARTALEQLRTTAREVFGEPSEMREALGKLDPKLKALPEVILDVSDRITEVERIWQAEIAERAPAIQEDPNAPDDWAEWQARARAVPVAQQAFAKIAGDQSLADFLRTAAKEIRHQAMVNAIAQLAVALAITVVTGMGAAALGRAVAGALIGESLPLAATSTRLAMAGLRIGIDIGVNVSINSAVQLAMADGKASAGAVVLENALMEVFTRAFMHPLRMAQEKALAYGRELSALPNLSAAERRALQRFDFAGAQMSIEMVGNMATQWAARHLVTTAHASGEEVSEPFALTVLQQGAAIGLGRFFHAQLAAWQAHKAALAKTRIGTSPQAHELFAARDAFFERAKELSESLSPDPRAGHELLRMNESLLKQERALVELHVADDASPHALTHEASNPRKPSRDDPFGSVVTTHPHEAVRPVENVPSSLGHVHAHTGENGGTSLAELDAAPLGERIAGVVGARYTGEGTFVISGARGPIPVEVRRTARLRVRQRGEGFVLEVPRGLSEPELERQVAGKLVELAHRDIEVALGHTGHESGLSAQDHGLIAELRVLRRQEQEAHARGTEGADEAAGIRRQIDAVEKRLGLAEQSEAGAQRRRMVETQIAVQEGAAVRAEEARRLGGERGHPGVEVHSHFMGIVDAEVFRQRASTVDGGEDTGSWIPLLERLNNIPRDLPKIEKDYWRRDNPGIPEARFKSNLPRYEHQFGPDGVISKRSSTGDAMEIVREAYKQVKTLHERAKDKRYDDADRAAFARAAEYVAEEASRTALSSTPETPFDGAYVLRGALVETTFGGGLRKEGETKADAEQRQYDDYIREALLRLAADEIHYSEQSTGIGKVGGTLHPDRIDRVLQQLVAEGKIRAGQIDVKMLGMLKTSHFGERDPSLPPVGKSGTSRKAHDKDVGAALRQVEQGGAIGIDIGAPEHMSFTPEGMNRWKAQLVELSNLGKATGNVQLSRPHVGEGAMDTLEGLPFHTDKNRHIIGDEPSHYSRARHNIEMMLNALESLPPGVLDPKYLVVRFGHVTHATPAQAARMKRLGVIAEVNLGSNVMTGSISQTQGVHGPRAPTDRFDDHSLPTLVYYDAAILLSTDGPDVMHTTLREEYARARLILEAVLSGELPVRISTADATVGDTVRGKEVSGRPEEREIRVWEMTLDERMRFERGYRKLYEDAERYYRGRPKGNRGAVVDVSAYTQIAIAHGLTPRFGHAAFEGSRNAVERAVDAYRAAGYAIAQSDADRGALAVVTSPDQQVTITLTVRTERMP